MTNPLLLNQYTMMRYLLSLLALTAILAAAAPGTAFAQNNLRADPGYLDLATVEQWFDAEPWLEVNIKGALLNLIVGAAEAEDDPELTSILSKLKAIEVRGYPLTSQNFDDIDRHTRQLAGRLESQGWETVVRLREDDERTNVFLKSNGNSIAGLVVMVLDPSDDDGAVFVNIVGDIDPKEVGRIGQRFDIDPLSNLGGSR
jgi:hypothetical protein